MTFIAEFFDVPQPLPHLQRDWVRENQGATLGEDPIINKNQRNTPPTNVVNHGGAVEPPNS